MLPLVFCIIKSDTNNQVIINIVNKDRYNKLEFTQYIAYININYVLNMLSDNQYYKIFKIYLYLYLANTNNNKNFNHCGLLIKYDKSVFMNI